MQKVLHDMLSQPNIKKINISKFCIEAQISRKAFYLRYKKINNCIEACILLELKRELCKNKNNTLKQLIRILCRYIQGNKIYFYNAYKLSEQDCICEKMREHFFQYIRSYVYDRGNFSELILKQLTNILYDRICFWISHGCDKSCSYLVEDLAIVIDLIDYQNQICSHKYQVFNFSHYYLNCD